MSVNLSGDLRPSLDYVVTPDTTTNASANVGFPATISVTGEATFNGGIDLGTSGRLDSNVVDAAAAVGFLLKPTTAFTSGTDRYLFDIQNSAGASKLRMFSDGCLDTLSAGSTGGYINIRGNLPASAYLGINFFPLTFGTTGSFGAFSTAVAGGVFAVTVPASSSAIGGFFQVLMSQATGTNPACYAGAFETSKSGAATYTAAGCIHLRDNSSNVKGTLTNWRGIYGESIATFNLGANRCWIDLVDLTKASVTGTQNSILLQQANSAYKALAFKDQNAWINANANVSGDLGLNGTNIWCNSTNIGFYSVTPVARPAAYTQTYATASRTHANPTATTVATTAATNVVPYGYTTQAQADDIITQLNALIADVANVKQVLNSSIDDDQSQGLKQ